MGVQITGALSQSLTADRRAEPMQHNQGHNTLLKLSSWELHVQILISSFEFLRVVCLFFKFFMLDSSFIATHFLFMLLQSGTELQAVSGTLAETDANKFGNRVGISWLLV